MYQYSKNELQKMGNEGWNVFICENENHAKAVQKLLKQEGHKARCGCIRNKNKDLIIFVLTDRPLRMGGTKNGI